MTLTNNIVVALISGMLRDDSLSPADFKVGAALALHMASRSPVADPSQAEIAGTVGFGVRHVSKSLSTLRQAGWLTWGRYNRQLTNEYRFDLARIDKADGGVA